MTLLHSLLFVENIMGVYRNFVLYNNFQKCLIYMRLIVEITYSFFISFNNIDNNSRANKQSGENIFLYTIYETVRFLKTLFIMVFGIRHSESYQRYYENVSIVHERYKNEASYLKSRKVLKITYFVSVTIYVVACVGLSVWELISIKELLWDDILETLYYTWNDFRYMLEHLVAYCVITEIQDFLQILNDSVQNILEYYKKKGNIRTCVDEEDAEAIEISERVGAWMELYQYILTCNNYMSQCLNELLTFSMVVIILQCVTLIYELIEICVKKLTSKYSYTKDIIYILIYHMVATITLLRAGQKVQNQITILNKTLAKLSLDIPQDLDKTETRPLRNLHRLVKTSPIVVKFGKFTLGMYLFPMILSLSVSYIVFMLQINHVV